jgi:hypothetical protein
MRVTTIDDGEAGEVAIHLDLIVHARFHSGKDGSLIGRFASDDNNKLVVQSPQAEKVWAA